MITYAHTYVTIMDVCQHNSLDFGDVMEEICHSDVSFGTNEDTMISQSMLEEILEKKLDWGGLDKTVLISLGS